MRSANELTSADWHRLNGLLAEALELEGEARRAWLQTLPESAADLRPLLTDLLAQSEARAADHGRESGGRRDGGDEARSRRRPDRSVAAGEAAGRRRHGLGVAGRAGRRGHEAHRGAEAAAGRMDRPGAHRTHRPRAADPRPAAAPGHCRAVRRRARRRWKAVPGPRIRRRRADRRVLQGPQRSRGAAAHGAGHPRRRLRPRATGHPPGPEAGQRPGQRATPPPSRCWGCRSPWPPTSTRSG